MEYLIVSGLLAALMIWNVMRTPVGKPFLRCTWGTFAAIAIDLGVSDYFGYHASLVVKLALIALALIPLGMAVARGEYSFRRSG